jgi:hypothetical protein
MSIEVRIYPSQDLQADEYLLFHARAYGAESYDIFFDLAGLYEYSFKAALNGTFISEHINRNTMETFVCAINGADYIDNTRKFCEYISEYEKAFPITDENVQLIDIFGVKLVGAPYRAEGDKPMVESYEFNVKRIMHQVKTNLFSLTPANNVDDVYSLKKTGSLIVTLSAARQYADIVSFVSDVYDDIEARNINPSKFNDEVLKYKYINLIEDLSELAKQRKLDRLYLIVGGVEKEIKARDYLKESASKLYNDAVKIEGIYEGYKAGNNSFEVKTINGKFYCHIVSDEILEKVKKLDPFKKTQVIVGGTKVKKQTIEVSDIKTAE